MLRPVSEPPSVWGRLKDQLGGWSEPGERDDVVEGLAGPDPIGWAMYLRALVSAHPRRSALGRSFDFRGKRSGLEEVQDMVQVVVRGLVLMRRRGTSRSVAAVRCVLGVLDWSEMGARLLQRELRRVLGGGRGATRQGAEPWLAAISSWLNEEHRVRGGDDCEAWSPCLCEDGRTSPGLGVGDPREAEALAVVEAAAWRRRRVHGEVSPEGEGWIVAEILRPTVSWLLAQWGPERLALECAADMWRTSPLASGAEATLVWRLASGMENAAPARRFLREVGEVYAARLFSRARFLDLAPQNQPLHHRLGPDVSFGLSASRSSLGRSCWLWLLLPPLCHRLQSIRRPPPDMYEFVNDLFFTLVSCAMPPPIFHRPSRLLRLAVAAAGRAFRFLCETRSYAPFYLEYEGRIIVGKGPVSDGFLGWLRRWDLTELPAAREFLAAQDEVPSIPLPSGR